MLSTSPAYNTDFPATFPVTQVTPALDDGDSANRQRANGRPSSPGSSPTRVCHLIDEADGWESAATQKKQPATVSKLLTLQHFASLSEESREETIARCVLLRAAPSVHSQQGWQQPASRGESQLSDAAIKDALTMAYSTMGSGGAAAPFVILQVCMASGAWTSLSGKEGDAPSSSSSSSPPPIAARLFRALIGLDGVASGPGMAVAQLLSPGWEQGRAREVDLPDQIGEKKCH